MFLMILICSLIIQQNDLQKKMRYVYDSPNRRNPFSVIFLYIQFGIITILVNWEEVKIIYMYNGSILIGLSDGLFCSGASESNL